MVNKYEANNIRAHWGRYPGSDIFVVGTGTSLAGFDFSILRGRLTIGLNDAVKIPGLNPTYHMVTDIGIWKRYVDMDYPKETTFVGQKRTRKFLIDNDRCKFKEQVYHFNHVAKARAMDATGDDLYVARTVATGGICLAWKLGAKRIFLLGVDGYKYANAYYHDGATKGKEKRKENYLSDGKRIVQDRHVNWQKNMDELREYFTARKLYQGPWPESGVYNCSIKSTISAWPKMRARDILRQQKDSPG